MNNLFFLSTMVAMETPFFTGMATGASLIIAIGAQNAFVLTQGLCKQHRFVVALICALCDAVLISAGVAGMGSLIEQSPRLMSIASGGGALFLFIYGLKSLYSAVRSDQGLQETKTHTTRSRQVILTTLAITLLNPHVYLDTVVLLGSISATFANEGRYLFGAGAISMSFIWFFTLAYGSGFLAPLFRKPITWRILDILIFLVMWNIAYTLLMFSGIVETMQKVLQP